MQLRLTWLVLVLFAVGIMSIGIVGCGTDEEEGPSKANREHLNGACGRTRCCFKTPHRL